MPAPEDCRHMSKREAMVHMIVALTLMTGVPLFLFIFG